MAIGKLRRLGSKGFEPSKSDDLQYDLARLTAFDCGVLDEAKLKDEKELERLTRDNVQLVIDAIYALPMETTADGDIIPLPAPTTHLPRSQPVPKPKPLTRWQKFAAEKGINKKKKEKMEWDPESKTWRPRWGYKGMNNDPNKEWVMEAKEGEQFEEGEDPFLAKSRAKKEAIQKQGKREERNKRESGKVVGLPETPAVTLADKRTKSEMALEFAQLSTASYGRFDKRLENESKPRVERGKTVVDSTDDLSTEKERTLGFLKRVVGADGSVKLDKDKVVRKLKSNDEATRHKAKLGGVAKKMASDESKKPRKSGGDSDGGKMYEQSGGGKRFKPVGGGRGEGQSADRLRSGGFKGNAGKGRDGGGGGGGKRGGGSKGSGRGGKRR